MTLDLEQDPARLITSEELTVLGVQSQTHPFYPTFAADRLELRGAA